MGVVQACVYCRPSHPACADQPEFLAAVKEVAASLQPVFERRPELLCAFEVMCEPERQVGSHRPA